jgi:RNA polymerase sigma-70 factor (ECF subfamily)
MDDVLKRFCEGDMDAFKWLYDHYASKMLIFATALLHDRPQAEDVVHNVFVKLWSQRSQFISYSSPNKLLYTATKNAVLDVFRHDDVITRNEGGIANFLGFQEGDEIEGRDAETILLHLVEKAVMELPPKRQKIFCLSRFSGLTNSRIAEMLGISVNTVNNQMHLALVSVKKYVADHLYDDVVPDLEPRHLVFSVKK